MARLKQNVPEIRFEGFSGEWEEKLLKKCVDITAGGTPDTKVPEYWNGDINWFAPAEIGKYRYADNSIRKITKLGLKKSSAKMLPADKTILFTSRAGIGDMAILKVDACTNQGFQSLIVKDNYDVYFIYSMGKFIKQQALRIASGSTFLEISGKALGGLKQFYPEKKEQTQIGIFFQQLDRLIELQTRAVEIAERHKKAMLQKLFPQKGEKVPRIRFAGFSGKLSTKKANKVFKAISEKNNEHLPVLSATQDKGIVYRNEVGIDIQYDKESLRNYKKISKDQFVIHLRSFQGGLAYSEIEGISSPAYTILDFIEKSDFYPLYWKYLFISGNFIKRLESITYGVRDGRSISFSDFSTLSFTYPSLEEQTAIGDFFQKLDEKITFEQRKLARYQMMKRAMLQRMFV